MFCPSCGAEYRAGFTTCADCGVALVSEPEPPPHHDGSDEDLDLVQVYRVGVRDAEMIRSVLEGSGIEAAVNVGGVAAYPVTVGDLGTAIVLVRRRDAERALEIIQAALSGEFGLDEAEQ